MQSRHKYMIFALIALLGLILGIGYVATDVNAGAMPVTGSNYSPVNPSGPNQQGTPVPTGRPTVTPTPPIGGQGEGIPTPVVFVIGLGIGLAVGYAIGRGTAPRNGPIDRSPGQRRG